MQNANSGVDASQRQEVLKRIDAMPNVTAANKEHLYAYVERAQKIKRVLNVNFERGKTKLGEAATKKLVEETRLPEFATQARDPAVVFVILGFATPELGATTSRACASRSAAPPGLRLRATKSRCIAVARTRQSARPTPPAARTPLSTS